MIIDRTISIRGEAIPAKRFDTTREMAEYAGARCPTTVFKGITQGDTALVSRSDALLDRIETLEKLADAKARVINTVTGGVANVPAFLMGSPMAMRMRRPQEAKAPLTICVSSITSGGCSKRLIERRGCAVLALLRKLEAAGHAVTLWLTAGQAPDKKTVFCAARMDSDPIDIARACYTLSNADVQRKLMFSVGKKILRTDTRYIDWPFGLWDWNERIAEQQSVYGQLLDVAPETVLIVPPVFISEERDFGSDEDAVDWVNKRYEQASAVHDVAA